MSPRRRTWLVAAVCFSTAMLGLALAQATGGGEAARPERAAASDQPVRDMIAERFRSIAPGGELRRVDRIDIKRSTFGDFAAASNAFVGAQDRLGRLPEPGHEVYVALITGEVYMGSPDPHTNLVRPSMWKVVVLDAAAPHRTVFESALPGSTSPPAWFPLLADRA